MDAIAEKFKDKDPVKKNQATMELYQQAGVNPLGGCIPVLVQMPILLAMFNFFPASIELRQQPFLWAEDLSSFDAIISWQAHIPLLSEYYGNHISLFTVLMTISTLIYTWMNSQMQGNTNQIPGMKYIMYGMPIMLLFWFNSYSAGLSYYYFLANIITFSQQWLIRKTIDEDAIHAKIQEKRANPKQKSKFAERLEAAQKQAKAKR
jgi:YidC/Oxa1 family membrane protein insertase